MRYQRQEGIRDCGVCCLYNIIRFHNGNIDLEKLRSLTKTNENGTSIYNIVETANKLGFKSKAYKCDINDLASIELPIIAYIKLDSYYHFVIIDDIDVDKITIFDPIRGKLSYSYELFNKEWQKIIITFERSGDIVKENSNYINYLNDLVMNNKNKLIVISILSFICTLFSIIISFFIKRIIDNTSNNNNFIIIFLIILFFSIITLLRGILSINLNNKIDYDLSTKVYKKLYSLPIEYHHNRPLGDMASRINDLYNVKDFISTFTMTTIIDILVILIISIILLFKSFTVFIITLTITFIYSSLYYLLKKDELVMLENIKENYSNNNSIFIENLNGIETIKNNNIEDRVFNKQNNLLIKYNNSYKKLGKYVLEENSINTLIEYIGLILVIFRGYALLNKGIFTRGDLTLIYSLYIMFFTSLKSIINLDRNIMVSKLSFNRINSLLKTPVNQVKGKSISSISNISFSNIKLNSFNFDLDINKGDKVLISGRSGVGKSTIFKSLIKENNKYKNNITIDGVNVNEINSNSIKNNISYISQNEYIFNDTIKNNILMHKNVSPKELNKALKVSTLDKVLKDKNISLDYILEENGHNLSSGERQKVLIARALIKNSSVIIFDETMNEIDIDNEKNILKRLFTEYKKTIVLISHRNSNVSMFNKKVEIK
ncbi:MAG: ATP-binding cassette domain-containing protein [Bacilli bacterium]|nr:ATP-binding cassette domain-containing protein [Bacilli bacterium]